jgi:hypothetical protein
VSREIRRGGGVDTQRRIRAEVSEERGALGRPHVSADEGYIAQLGTDRLHGPTHDLRVPLSDVDQDHIRAAA